MFKRKLLATTALAVMLSSSVMLRINDTWAADMIMYPGQSVPEPAPASSSQGFCPADNLFSGAYVGVHAGYLWGKTEVGSDFSENGPVDSNGFIGGLHLGCLRQFSNGFVLGVEGDVSYTDFGSTNHLLLDNDIVDMGFRSNVQGSLRLRAGFAMDRTLIYATGGLAVVHGKATVPGQSDSNTHVGWTVGGGVEHAFTDEWRGRVELRYSDFGSKTYFDAVDIDFKQTSILLGISRKF